jgi:hypothetical protein
LYPSKRAQHRWAELENAMDAHKAQAMPLSKQAESAGAKLAQQAFNGRKGHGGGAITTRNVSQPELAAMLGCAFQIGVESACNAHDQLVAALRELIEFAEPVLQNHGFGYMGKFEKARRALAAAGAA